MSLTAGLTDMPKLRPGSKPATDLTKVVHVGRSHFAPLFAIALAPVMLTLTGCTGTTSSSGGGNPVAPSLATQPSSQTVTAGQAATFSVMATGTAPLSYQWQKNGANISGAMSSSYTTPVTTMADSGEQFRVMVSNAAGSVTSNTATLNVNASSTGSTDVVTHHYNVSRSGVNSTETVLTPSNVNSATFGKVGEFTISGQVDGQALFVSQLAIP